MWNVDIELIARWLATLDRDSQAQVVAAIELLEDRGPHLGRPVVDDLFDDHLRRLKGRRSR
ncbi:MAG: type II toxin-antitoxin system RelE/ParE family toxin [Dermatophilaceae bacterium]|nr:type II toxin-antitoxin system RelE/ParE family toxin [Intrasporangiaceae bacterium]